MFKFELYQAVKILKLLHAADSYEPWRLNKRRPFVGDIGTLLELLETPNGVVRDIVESLNIAGETIWLAEFEAEELEATLSND